MRHSETLTILSTNAPLVEVSGDGPTSDIRGGLTIPDGAAITAPVDLLNAPIRRWRVDAPPSVKTAVVVTDSPYGAFVGVHRSATPIEPRRWTSHLAASGWPWLHGVLKQHAPSVLALWNALTDDVQPCTWHDVGDGASNQAQARGGDLVVVHFVSP
jgi:hypothetical protein